MATNTKPKTKTKVQPTVTFDEALNRYYKLKGEYDKIRRKAVRNIADNQLLSSTEKHEKYIAEKKKCIVCGKSGGTIFRQEGTILTAKCGNEENPCRLNIQLQRA